MAPIPKPQWKVLPIHEVIDILESFEEFDVQSNPPSGKKRIKNIYWDPDTKEVVIETEE